MEKKYLLENLDCPNCANKLERKINTLKGVKSASIDFMHLALLVEFDEEIDHHETLELIKKIVKELEPDVNVLDYKKVSKHHNHHEHHDHHHHEHKEECGCGHHHEHKHKKLDNGKIKLILMIVSFIIFLVPIIFQIQDETIVLIINLVAYFIVGFELLYKSIKNILKGEIFDENFLMSIATIVAFIIGEYQEAYGVMIFYQVGEYLQDYAVNKSRKSISKMLELKTTKASLLVNDEVKTVSFEELEIGDIILIKVGEQVPVDGVIVEGYASMDTSFLTGESLLVDKKENDEVLSGMINKQGVIKVRVSKHYEDSLFSKILDLVENATSKKSNQEKFITKFAKIYTPLVVGLAFLIAVVPLFFQQDFNVWGYRACVFLVTSCPCALVVSVPLSYFVSIGKASKKGILIKGSNYLDALNKIKYMYLDKTGTLSKGKFKVEIIKPIDIEEQELLYYVRHIESMSNHPIAKSIIDYSQDNINIHIISKYEEVPGKGVEGYVDNHYIKAGTYDYVGLEVGEEEVGTIIYVSKDNKYIGYIVIRDEIKEDAKELISNLYKLNINPIMLTGDKEDVASLVANNLGIKEYHYQLLPQEKVEIIKNNYDVKCFVGDGINDAPSLVSSDVGISMGQVGSDVAIESSDIVLMKDNLASIIDVINISKRTNKIVVQNIVFSLLIKIVIMVLGVFGLSSLWLAVFADVGVTLLAILNSLRLIK